MPLYGLYISNIRKIAPDTDNAAVNNVAKTVGLRGANNPQLTKTMVSQKTIMTIIGLDTEVAPCSYNNHRVCTRFNAMVHACDFIAR